MRIVSLDGLPLRANEANGSRGFAVGALGLAAEAHLVVVRLRPGGVIGRHPAAGRQLLVLLSGDATVAGEDGTPVPLLPGQGAVWEPFESHETRSVDGMTALVVEGEVEVGDAQAAVLEADWA